MGIRGKVKFPPTNHKLQNRSALQQRRAGDVGTGPNSSIKNRTGKGNLIQNLHTHTGTIHEKRRALTRRLPTHTHIFTARFTPGHLLLNPDDAQPAARVVGAACQRLQEKRRYLWRHRSSRSAWSILLLPGSSMASEESKQEHGWARSSMARR